MAQTPPSIPERCGAPRIVLRPRAASLGRRLRACLPALVLAGLCAVIIAVRRPGSLAMAVLVLLLLGCAAAAWRWLRPVTAVVTDSHVLASGLVGWRTASRDRVERAVVVDTLGRSSGSGASSGSRGAAPKAMMRRPYLWLADARGRRVLQLDGTVWDRTSLTELLQALDRPVTRYAQATAGQVAADFPRLVHPLQRWPWLGTLLSGIVVVAAALLVIRLTWDSGPFA